MLKKFRYRLSLNAALRELGLPIADMNPAFREEVLELGMRERLLPREAALELLSVIYPSLNLVDRLTTLAVIRRWRGQSAVSEHHYQRAIAGELPDVHSAPFLKP